MTNENTPPNDLAEHIAAVLDGHHGGHLKAPLAAWTEPHRDGVQIRVVLQRALSGGEDETFLLHAERLDTGGPHAIRDRWPFAPGQIVRDSGEGDDAAWLDAAPVGTAVQNAEGCEWTRGVHGWFGAHPSWATSADLVEHGPLTVVSVPDCCDHLDMEQGHCYACYDSGHAHDPERPCPPAATLHDCTVDETAGGAETTGAVERGAEAIREHFDPSGSERGDVFALAEYETAARAALDAALDGTCEATVYDGDDTDRPCDSSAIVGYRLDHDDDQPWPVCGVHAHNLVTLRTTLLGTDQ